ncbi:MAG: class I SAM-dependent methyltransferase [Lachnospiraceae bacterium]|nr:class I SAM-dependent methyltransferase [Lachnospiraceae bacterium]
MEIEKQFNRIAEEYDCNRRKFIPCFEDFYINTTKFIAANIKEPKRIVDLGAGTGLLTYYWYQCYPHSEYILVDIADEMLNVARKRFENIKNISSQAENYIHKLPDTVFDMVISALSIHHLEDPDKIKLFSKIYDSLPNGGLFINYDQFCAGQSEMDIWFDSYWENHISNSGLTENDIILWKERRKLDRECCVEQEITMLKNCAFNVVKCVYSYQKFSVIVAIK